jgi:altronate hydrolase
MNEKPHPQDCALHLHPDDPIAIARCELQAGTEVSVAGRTVNANEAIPAGHKVALRDIAAGEDIRRYGYFIGKATAFIPAGSWVHSHNLELGDEVVERTYRIVEPVPTSPSGKTFMGYGRPNRSAGLRNLIAVISSVTCSAHVASQIGRAFRPND